MYHGHSLAALPDTQGVVWLPRPVTQTEHLTTTPDSHAPLPGPIPKPPLPCPLPASRSQAYFPAQPPSLKLTIRRLLYC